MELAGALLDVVVPVYALVGIGALAARLGLVAPDEVGRFSAFTFAVFVPALLFRSMVRADPGTLHPEVPAAFFAAALILFAAVTLSVRRRATPAAAAVAGLSATYGNNVMIGVPLVALGWGDEALAMLLSIVAFNSLVLLTLATFVVESGSGDGGALRAAGRAARQALLHPVIAPIAAGAAWQALGVPMPAPLDATLSLLGGAAVPICLVLLGASLVGEDLRALARPAMALSALKLVAMPALAWALGAWVFALAPLPLTVVVLAASLPIGANVFLFAQRYRVDGGAAAAAVVASTVLSAPLLAVSIPWLPVPPR